MLLKVAAPDVHSEEAVDDGVWVIIRRRLRKAMGREKCEVLTEDVFNEG